MGFLSKNYNKEAKSLTFWRGSEVSQEVVIVQTKLFVSIRNPGRIPFRVFLTLLMTSLLSAPALQVKLWDFGDFRERACYIATKGGVATPAPLQLYGSTGRSKSLARSSRIPQIMHHLRRIVLPPPNLQPSNINRERRSRR